MKTDTYSHLQRIVILFFGIWMMHFELVWAESGIPPLQSGQTFYVPAYSHIQHGMLDDKGRPKKIYHSSMLSVRNTDPKFPMRILSVKYYDNDGNMLQEFQEKPLLLPPMGSTDYFVDFMNRKGGTGANFLVVWKADTPINQPIMETVQVYFFGNQSLAFVSRGQAIQSHE
ncbi:MAG: DUF3124 domain-containing protein [Magnetococcus sp. DMHC-6]